MKKNLIIISMLALTVAAASCAQFPDIPEFEGEGILLTLDTSELVLTTKAGRDTDGDGLVDGVAAYNENLLGSGVEVFFFQEDAEETTASVWHERVALTNTTLLQIPLSISEIATIFSGTVPGNTAKVYVIANYNGSEALESGVNYSMAQLKAKQLARANWSAFPQDNFVMTGLLEDLTLVNATASTPASGTVMMKRVASKVSFKLTVADEIVVENVTRDAEGNITKKELEKWSPIKTSMTVYLQYGMNYATLGAEPSLVPTDPKALFDPDVANSQILYTYPEYPLRETTENITRPRTIIDELIHNDPATLQPGQEEWEVRTHLDNVPVPVYAPTLGSGDGATEGPFYTYPVTWGTGTVTEPFLKLIIPWNNGSRTKYYYYKIPFPVAALESNNWYEIVLDVQILGGENELPVPLEANYHVVDWVPGSTAQASVVSARYLNVPTKSFTMYNTEDLEIPMLSSHECEIVNVSVSKPQYGTSTYINRDVRFPNATLRDGKLVVGSLEEIDLKHTINNNMGANLDCAPYTITFRVQQIDQPADFFADITVKQYPAIYVQKQAGGNAFVDGYYTLVTSGRPESGNGGGYRDIGNTRYYYHGGNFNPFNDGTRITPYGNLNGGTANNATVPSSEKENTIIHVTAFSENSNTYTFNGLTKSYIIADPRIPFMEADAIKNKTMTKYLESGRSDGRTADWTVDQLNALMVGTDVDNIIAPAFMFASEFGRQGTGESSFETVAHRCATYQEAGYPAGRWRLPTQAEVAFVANLQANNFIGKLFDAGRYWISNGTAITVSGSSVNVSNQGGNSTRCVYDIWYWGEEPITSPENKDYDPTYKDYYYYVMP